LPKKLQFFALQRQNEKNSQTFFKRNPEEEHKKEKNAESQEASYIPQKLKKVSYHTAAPHSGNCSSLHGSKGATPDKSPQSQYNRPAFPHEKQKHPARKPVHTERQIKVRPKGTEEA